MSQSPASIRVAMTPEFRDGLVSIGRIIDPDGAYGIYNPLTEEVNEAAVARYALVKLQKDLGLAPVVKR